MNIRYPIYEGVYRILTDYGQTGNENSHSDEGEGGEEYCVNAKTLSDM